MAEMAHLRLADESFDRPGLCVERPHVARCQPRQIFEARDTYQRGVGGTAEERAGKL